MWNYKDAACAVLAAMGAWFAELYGGWNGAMTTLLIFVCADFLSGLCAPQHRSHLTRQVAGSVAKSCEKVPHIRCSSSLCC